MTSINDYPWAALFQYHHQEKRLDTWGCSGAYIGKTNNNNNKMKKFQSPEYSQY